MDKPQDNFRKTLHSTKSQLTVIYGYIQMLENTTKNESNPKSIAIIQKLKKVCKELEESLNILSEN